MDLSIVILCYRSGYDIVPFIEKVKTSIEKASQSFEIILVANYLKNSNDITGDVVKEIAKESTLFKVVCKEKKGMMGWDMREGLSYCSGNYICVIDGDGQFPIESIQKGYNEIKKGKYQFIKTYRVKREDSLYRNIISKIYNLVFSILFPKINSKDINSKPKIFTKEIYNKMNLTSDDWFIDAEIMLEIERLKIDFYEFPIHFLSLNQRQSFVKFSAIFEFLKNLIFYRIKHKR